MALKESSEMQKVSFNFNMLHCLINQDFQYSYKYLKCKICLMPYGVIRVIISECKKCPGLSTELCCTPLNLKSSCTVVIIATILSLPSRV